MRALLAVLILACAGSSAAHDARPLSIAIVEQTESLYRAITRAPPTIDNQNTPQVIWPERCEVLESAPLDLSLGTTTLLRCPDGLEQQQIRIHYPIYNPSITTLFRLQTVEGAPITAILPPDELVWEVPPEPTFFSVARDYARLGIQHIWQGPDHLLFVAGLLLLARLPRRILWAITGFTAAHSITLSLAALGIVRLAVEPVEAMIALSILFLAVEIARNDPSSFSSRFPIALSFVFGLLHGFGFASALGEIGLPRGELAAGLAFFNIGVEIGQLAFITVLIALALAIRRLLQHPPAAIHEWIAARHLVTVGSYCLGIPAAYWFVARTALAFGA